MGGVVEASGTGVGAAFPVVQQYRVIEPLADPAPHVSEESNDVGSYEPVQA